MKKEKAIVDRTQDKRLTIDTLGKYKISDWSFQNEYRYRLFALFDSKRRKNVFFNPTDSAFKIFSSLNQPISDEFIFFGIDENVLSKIEIVRGPNISDGNRILLDALLDKYSIDKNRAFDSKFTDK